MNATIGSLHRRGPSLMTLIKHEYKIPDIQCDCKRFAVYVDTSVSSQANFSNFTRFGTFCFEIFQKRHRPELHHPNNRFKTLSRPQEMVTELQISALIPSPTKEPPPFRRSRIRALEFSGAISWQGRNRRATNLYLDPKHTWRLLSLPT